MGSYTMPALRLGHIPAFLEALHCVIPGLIHALKTDGGAKSIANFTNFATCQPEILWAFRIIGVWGLVTGLSVLVLIYLSATEDGGGFYSKVLQLFTGYQLTRTLLLLVVVRVTGNGTASVAPEAPGNATPLVAAFLH